MKMTDVERVLLLNQYAILSRLSSNEHEKSDYDLMISALSSGYDDDFEQMFSHIPEPFAIEIMNEVREILEMFRALGPREGGRIPPPRTSSICSIDDVETITRAPMAALLLFVPTRRNRTR